MTRIPNDKQFNSGEITVSNSANDIQRIKEHLKLNQVTKDTSPGQLLMTSIHQNCDRGNTSTILNFLEDLKMLCGLAESKLGRLRTHKP